MVHFWAVKAFLPPFLSFFPEHAIHAPRYLTQLLVKTYRTQLGMENMPLSFARFAKALTQNMPQLKQVSPQTIKNWERGFHCPNFFLILKVASHAPEGTWQRAFARDLLAVQWPMLYEPGSEIGAKYVQALLGA